MNYALVQKYSKPTTMKGKTFAEKIFGAETGSIVFKKPDIILSHDNTASIFNTFKKMGGEKVKYPEQLLIVLDHNAPPTSAKLAINTKPSVILSKNKGLPDFTMQEKGFAIKSWPITPSRGW